MPDGGEVNRLGARIARAIARRTEKAGDGWWTVLRQLGAEIARDNVSMMAAAVAFYGLLSIFPGLSMVISLYGLFANPNEVGSLLSSLGWVLPHEAVELLSRQLFSLLAAAPAKLGVALLASIALALWSSMSGTATLMQALTRAQERKDDRGILRFYLVAAALTVGLVLFGCCALLLVIVLPAAMQTHALPPFWRDTAGLLRWPLLVVLGVVGVAIAYRFAAPQKKGDHRWITAGAILATLLWIVSSAGFSFYVGNFASYDRTYGPLGAVVVLLLWFYLTAFIMLAGAEFDSVLERRSRARSRAKKSA